MEFEINNEKWKIEERTRKELSEIYKAEEQPEDGNYFIFGLLNKAKHLIFINKEVCREEQIKTLKHELTHCYIWTYGLYNVPNFTEEMACDLVANSNEFINEVVGRYFKTKSKKK